jgi:two-component sensor histidine kinase
MHCGDKNINLRIEAADIYLSVTQAIPCGLAVNEIISNAYKHAFDGKEDGEIAIFFQKKQDQKLHLNIKDNGIGIPDHVNIDNTETLGIKLVRNLVLLQLKGDLQVNSSGGTEIDIEFQLIKS